MKLDSSLLDIACTAALTAGERIAELYHTTEYTKKADGSPVTFADLEANRIIIEKLGESGIQILSEESEGIAVPYPETLWIIDPLDGTRDFLEKTDDFAVMIGLLHAGSPVLGVVYAPAHNTLYYAQRSSGAWMRRGKEVCRLSVSNQDGHALRMIKSNHHRPGASEDVASALGATVIHRGGIGIKAGVIVEANADFYFSKGMLGEWDVCAPHILIEEAGGMVTDSYGEQLRYGSLNHRIQTGVIFSNALCHTHVLSALNE